MDEKWSSGLVAVSRPTFVVNGSSNAKLVSQLQYMSTLETQDLLRCEVTFSNWENGGTGYLYSDNSIFDLNRQLQIRVGNPAIFSGRITGITSRHPRDTAPSITITAEAPLRITGSKRRISKSWKIVYGQSLREITIDHIFSKISGQAAAEFNGFLRVGDSIIICGVGSRFDGNYAVSEVRHLFDLQSGLRTEFRVESDELPGKGQSLKIEN